MEKRTFFRYVGMVAFLILGLIVVSGCTSDFLKPDPLSFYEPSNTFTTRKGLESALSTCDKHIRNMTFATSNADGAPILSEFILSDLGVSGSTDISAATRVTIDVNTYMTPIAHDDPSTVRYTHFWSQAYSGVKYANSIITNINDVPDIEPKLKNEMLGRAYFHRAIKYYNLVFQFKDIPLFTQEVRGPKFDYRSTKRSVILEMLTKDLEFAVQNVPETVEYGGMANKGACRQLLIKCYLSTGQFDKAIAHADTLINLSGYRLMTEPFGDFINPMPSVHKVTRNVIWDLHRPENKMNAANKETILCMIDRYGYEGFSFPIKTMRNCVPFWVANGAIGIMTPDGQQGMNISTEYLDYRKTYGRGVARLRPTDYAQHGLWVGDPTDLRHDSQSGNWMTMEQLKYNNPDLVKNKNPYAGQNIRLYADNGTLLCTDTIRNWFAWPHYKVWLEDPDREANIAYEGGPADWYVYRLAETYLLRAEAYMWKGNKSKAAEDVNAIRQRAHCTKLFTANDMNMGVVMDERARELYMEEWRRVELSRVSYIFALTGQTDEFGQTYKEETISDNSYWWQRICKYNNFYNSGTKTRSNVKYTISPYHIFFPVPQSGIDGNREDIINQNKGYAGYEHNVTPFDNLEDAIKSELDYSKQ